jgi:hypothetical protein
VQRFATRRGRQAIDSLRLVTCGRARGPYGRAQHQCEREEGGDEWLASEGRNGLRGPLDLNLVEARAARGP